MGATFSHKEIDCVTIWYYYTNEHSNQWLYPGENTPKKANGASSAGKVMDIDFGKHTT